MGPSLAVLSPADRGSGLDEGPIGGWGYCVGWVRVVAVFARCGETRLPTYVHDRRFGVSSQIGREGRSPV